MLMLASDERVRRGKRGLSLPPDSIAILRTAAESADDDLEVERAAV
jgi:hypothetical protein